MTEDLDPFFKGVKTWHGMLFPNGVCWAARQGFGSPVLGILPHVPLGIPALRQCAGSAPDCKLPVVARLCSGAQNRGNCVSVGSNTRQSYAARVYTWRIAPRASKCGNTSIQFYFWPVPPLGVLGHAHGDGGQ